jgi:hypothetical protein
MSDYLSGSVMAGAARWSQMARRLSFSAWQCARLRLCHPRCRRPAPAAAVAARRIAGTRREHEILHLPTPPGIRKRVRRTLVSGR